MSSKENSISGINSTTQQKQKAKQSYEQYATKNGQRCKQGWEGNDSNGSSHRNMLNYRQLQRNPKYKAEWNISAANEFGQLANGVGGRVEDTKTIKFIQKQNVPKNGIKDVTYGSFVCTIRKEKDEKNRTKFVVKGNWSNFPGDMATPTAGMMVEILLFNSVV